MVDQVSNIKFIQEVEKNHCLYDNKTKNNLEKKWIEVGKIFNLTGMYLKQYFLSSIVS